MMRFGWRMCGGCELKFLMTVHFVLSLSMKMELLRDIQRNATSSDSSTLLLEMLLILTSDDSAWGNIVMDHLLKSKLFHFLRHILIQVVRLLCPGHES
jgi:hypothetical protein